MYCLHETILCPQDARRSALAEEEKWQGNMPPLPGLKQRTVSISRNLSDLSSALDQRRCSPNAALNPEFSTLPRSPLSIFVQVCAE